MSPTGFAESNDGLTVVAHRGVGEVLLAFDLDQSKTAKLAGFAITRLSPGNETKPLLNRLSFAQKMTKDTTPDQREWAESADAPFQKFRWVDVPPTSTIEAGNYTYTVTARYFSGADNALVDGPSVSVSVPLVIDDWAKFQLGFTRGYLSSQAYSDKFQGPDGKPLDFRPNPQTVSYDTTPYRAQYEFLGFTGRKIVFEFLDDCVNDTTCTMDMFAFDLDEPDVLRRLQSLGARLRAFLDNSKDHTKAGAREIDALALLRTSTSDSSSHDHIRQGHFGGLAHCKVFIKRDSAGKAVRVLAGSANFSVRGLYAQANNVFVYDDQTVAGLYATAFDQAFDDPPSAFATSPLAGGWQPADVADIPESTFCFSPHAKAEISLADVQAALLDTMTAAEGGGRPSVLYAVMQLETDRKDTAGHVTLAETVPEALQRLANASGVFTYGIVDQPTKAVIYTPGAKNGLLVTYAYLHGQVPWPFKEEPGRDFPRTVPGHKASPPFGQVIHDKFVVVDFNGPNPCAFFGSSNLANGGEVNNGDSLVKSTEPAVVSAFAVEAVRLIDHFHFRGAMTQATASKPLTLQGNPAGLAPEEVEWWKPYYDSSDLKFTERVSLAHVAPVIVLPTLTPAETSPPHHT